MCAAAVLGVWARNGFEPSSTIAIITAIEVAEGLGTSLKSFIASASTRPDNFGFSQPPSSMCGEAIARTILSKSVFFGTRLRPREAAPGHKFDNALVQICKEFSGPGLVHDHQSVLTELRCKCAIQSVHSNPY